MIHLALPISSGHSALRITVPIRKDCLRTVPSWARGVARSVAPDAPTSPARGTQEALPSRPHREVDLDRCPGAARVVVAVVNQKDM